MLISKIAAAAAKGIRERYPRLPSTYVVFILLLTASLEPGLAKVHHRPKAVHSRLCTLHHNIIETKRQLRECSFQSVVVVVSPEHAWQKAGNGMASSSGRINTTDSPFPVVICQPVNHTVRGLSPDVYSRGLPEEDHAPPCMRPVNGREEVAYAAFILQNYDSLPDHMYFVHGHDTCWHQDKPINSVLREFANRTMPGWLYVSLNLRLNQDWRKVICWVPWGCHSTRMQRALEKAYSSVFQEYLGPMPNDLTHFCCAQFLVSSDRVRARPWALYAAIMQWSLREWSSSAAPGLCYDDTCGKTSHLMEVLWPLVFHEPMPFDTSAIGMSQWRFSVVPNRFSIEAALPSAVAEEYRRRWSTGAAGLAGTNKPG